MLTHAEELALVARANEGDQKAMAKLVEAHEPLFLGMAKRWKRTGDEDFLSAMRLCFIEKLPRFDPTQGFRVNTYLRWHLMECASQYHRKNRSLIVVGESLPNRRLRAANSEMQAMEKCEGRELTSADIAGICQRHDVNRADLEHYITMHSGMMPIDALDDGNPYLVQPARQDDDLYRQQQHQIMKAAIATLNPREQRIIMTRHYTQDDIATLEDLSLEFGVSRERIRQVEMKALEKLKAVVTKTLAKPMRQSINDNCREANAA